MTSWTRSMLKSEFLSTPFLFISATSLCASISSASFFLYPEHLRALGMGSREIGFVMSGFFVGAVLGVPLASRLAGILGRESLSNVGLLALATAAPMLLLSTSPLLSFVGRTLQGIGWTAVQIATMVMATSLEPRKTAQAAAILGLAFIVGQGVGPSLVAALSAYTSVALFWTSMLFALLPCLGSLVVRMSPGEAKEESVQSQFRASLRSIAFPIAITCLLNAPFLTTVSLIADHAHLLGLVRATSSFFVAFVASSVVCRLLLAHVLNSTNRHIVIAFSGAVASVALLVLAHLEQAWGLWLAGALFGLANSGYIPSLQAILIDRLENRVRAVALFRLAMELSGAVAIVVGGIVADWLGYATLFAIAAGVAAAGSGAMLLEPVLLNQISSRHRKT
jgi:MFS family permease